MLCSRDFDEETGKLHVKIHSEKWGGFYFYVLLLFCLCEILLGFFMLLLLSVLFLLLFYFSEFLHLVTFIQISALCNVLCLYHFAVVLVYCNEKLYAYLKKIK